MTKITLKCIQLSFFTSLFLLLLSHANSQLNVEEQSILLNLKQHWQNPQPLGHWTPSNSTSHCSWPEITCGTNGSVTRLSIKDCKINGTVPLFIRDLKNLTILDLSNNSLASNEFPRALYNFSKLQYLDLSQNYFAGTVPDDIHRMAQLRQLNLEANSFSGNIPASIGQLTELRELQLVQTQFNGSFPPEIGNLSNLERLELAYITGLTTTLPSEFTKLRKLKYLWVAGSNLVGEIPNTIGEMAALEHLDLSRNNLSGTIPSGLFMPKNLIIVYLYKNKLSGEIPRVVEASNIDVIDLSENSLTGTIPNDFGRLTKLLGLALNFNQLSGKIPDSIGRLPELIKFNLFSNNLSGALPPDLGRYSMLEDFQVSSNRLTGQLPKHLGDNGRLVRVVAFDNNLSGELPKSLGNCNNLIIVSVRNNLLNGTIPQEIAALPSLTILLLDRNRLSGSLPSNILSWKLMTTLNLSRNAFSGQIPEEFGFLPGLSHLDLSENQLSGQIPPQLGILNLISLNLSSNHLTGRVPSVFDNGAYVRSFLNNPGLCAFTSSVTDDKCNSESSKISVRFLVLIICLVIATLVLALFFVIIIFMRRKQGSVLTWKLTSFQRLNFTGSDIMAGLTENNVIGCGGSGTVYRVAVNPSRDIAAVNPSCDFVAVKRIWSNGMLEQKLEKQFLAEVRTLSSIRHSKIVKLLCFISSDDSKLLVYEYLENGSLDLWLHRQSGASTVSDSVQHVNLDWPKRLQIAVGAAQGLSYMHHDCSQPIVHRDVKSSNILLDSEFNAKIADFGLAKMLIKHGESATTSVVAGTFGYIAPEYAQTGRVNKMIDVYSFGVVLLELTTGRKANDVDENTSLVQWAWRQIRENKPIVDVLDEEVRKPCNLDEMCSVFKLGILCTSTNPSERPSMEEVLKNLLQPNPAPNCGSLSPNGPHSGSGQRPTCQVCGRLGHTAFVCYYWFDQTFQADGPNLSAHTVATSQSQDLNLYPDIGASHHITSNLSNLNIHSEESDGSDQIQASNGTQLMQENQ